MRVEKCMNLKFVYFYKTTCAVEVTFIFLYNIYIIKLKVHEVTH